MTDSIVLVGFFLFVGWLWRHRNKETGDVSIPPWLWRVIGAFLAVMLVRHLSEALSFVSTETDNWFPLVMKSASKIMADFRHFFIRISGK